jgi:EAL domain-containing protein (putative c-di-GMP-specific phosphodiesterase class I)
MNDGRHRKYPRISIMGLVYLRWEGEAHQTEGYLANLSQAGAGVYVSEGLRVGERVDLVVVSGSQRASHSAPISGWVVWCKTLGKIHHAGLRFADLNEHRYRDLLRSYNFDLENTLATAEADVGAARVAAIIDQRMIRPVFQPIIDLQTGEVLAYEALARFTDGAVSSPAVVYDAAARVGRIGELGWLFRRMAIEQCRESSLFLNLRPEEFGEGWLVQQDDPIFRHTHPVYLEITESDPLHYFEQVRSFLAEARSRGVRLAVDDLGAGFSNLKYISDLEPDIVKLDRQLVAGLTRTDRRFRLVKSIVSLCTDMGAKVVAEGVETVEEMEASIEAGAHFGQGYLFARPASPAPKPAWPPR